MKAIMTESHYLQEPASKNLANNKKSTRLFALVKKFLISLVVLGVLSGIGYWAYQQFFVTPSKEGRRRAKTAKVERLTLPISVTANGTVQPEKLINASPKTSGRLKSLLVKEGDRVEQGQILAYMDNSNLQGQLQQAMGQLGAAEAGLQKLLAGNRPQEIIQAQAALANSQASLRQAELNLKQNQALFNSGAISSRDFETSRTIRDNTLAQVKVQQQLLAVQNIGARPEDIQQARSQVEAAKGAVQIIQSQIEDTIIRAAFNGTVIKKYADPGSFVTPTTSGSAVSSATASSILSLAANNQVVANVAERNIAQVKVGQTVSIQADAYANQTFKGEVISISPQTTVTQNVSTFEVKVAIRDQSKQLLRSGMNVNAEFKVGQLKNALMIPTVAIARQPSGTGVYMRTEKGQPPEFVPLTTGITINDKTEVKSGLKEGDKVLISFPEGLRPQSPANNQVPGLPGTSGGGRNRG
jgi:HlyD family secretion protein